MDDRCRCPGQVIQKGERSWNPTNVASNVWRRSRKVARMLGVSRATVYNLMDAGKLSYVKIGSARCVEPEAIQRLIAELRVGSDPALVG